MNKEDQLRTMISKLNNENGNNYELEKYNNHYRIRLAIDQHGSYSHQTN